MNGFLSENLLPHRTIFVMMRFVDSPEHEKVLTTIRSAVEYYGFNALRADDRSYSSHLWENVRCYMDGCGLGIVIFDQVADQTAPLIFNPNVSLELGYMLGQGKKCLLLKDKRLPVLPTDLSGELYREFDFQAIEQTIHDRVRDWMNDLAVLVADDERLLVFVSQAGMDRCAMAKAILKRLTRPQGGHKLPCKLRIESAGKGYVYASTASKSAKAAIEDVCQEDLLSDHKCQPLSGYLKDRASLILVMTDDLKRDLPQSKTFTLKEFFGMQGNIGDPAPDRGDPESLNRFKKTANELKDILADPDHLMKLDEYLEQSKA